MTLLPIIQALNGFSTQTGTYPKHSPDGKERYIPFHLTFADYQAGLPPVGVLRPEVVEALQEDAAVQEQRAYDRGTGDGEGVGEGAVWQFLIAAYPPADEAGGRRDIGDALDSRVVCIFLSDWALAGRSERISAEMTRLVEGWKAEGRFAARLKGWRNERYQVFHPLESSFPRVTRSAAPTGAAASPASAPTTEDDVVSGPRSNTAFTIERAAGALFGLPTYGVHMTAYEWQGREMRVWIPKRAMSKSTYPGYLDNAAAGGIPCGMMPIDSMVKECKEEVGWPDRNTGVVTFRQLTKDGYPISEVLYTYDLHLPPQTSAEYIAPNPPADEFESFELLDIPTIRSHLLQNHFKPASAAVMLDFLLRHGHVNAENEPNLTAIKWGLSVPLGLAMPS